MFKQAQEDRENARSTVEIISDLRSTIEAQKNRINQLAREKQEAGDHELRALRNNERYREALYIVREWQVPEGDPNWGGSNGERDYMKGMARRVLNGEKP